MRKMDQIEEVKMRDFRRDGDENLYFLKRGTQRLPYSKKRSLIDSSDEEYHILPPPIYKPDVSLANYDQLRIGFDKQERD